MVKGDWIKPGATVIDVGINRSDDGLHGDVDFDDGGRGRRRHHAGPRRRRPDDDRLPAAQHAAGGADGGGVSRLRAGEWLAGAGAAALLVTLFLPWFGVELPRTGRAQRRRVRPRRAPAATSGWNALGWLVIAARARRHRLRRLAGVATATGRPVAQVVAASRARRRLPGRSPSSSLALRALVFQPGPNDLVALRYGAWLGLLGRARASPSAAGGRSRTSAPTRPRAPTPRPSRARRRAA